MTDFKGIGVLAAIVADDALFTEINAKGSVWEDSELWRITYSHKTGYVDLFNKNSGTRSKVQVTGAGNIVAETFKFIPRESGRHSDDKIWLNQHLEKIGI